MIVPSVQVQSRVPGFEEKSLLVIGFKTNDLEVFKVNVVGHGLQLLGFGKTLPLPFCSS